LAANAPEFITELQKLKVKNELNASDVKKCFGDAWYDNLPSVKSNGGVDSQMTKIQTEELKDCVKQHRSYIMKKAGLSKRLLDLTEEEPNLKDQLLLYQLKCRDAQASIKASKEAQKEKLEKNNTFLLKVKDDTDKASSSILSKVEIEEEKNQKKALENLELKKKLEHFIATIKKQDEHQAAVVKALELHKQLTNAKTAQTESIIATLNEEENNRNLQLKEQNEKINDLLTMKSQYIEKNKQLQSTLKQNIEYSSLLKEKQNLLNSQKDIIQQSYDAQKAKLKIVEAQVITLALSNSSSNSTNSSSSGSSSSGSGASILQNDIEDKALKCKELQAKLKALKLKKSSTTSASSGVTENSGEIGRSSSGNGGSPATTS